MEKERLSNKLYRIAKMIKTAASEDLFEGLEIGDEVEITKSGDLYFKCRGEVVELIEKGEFGVMPTYYGPVAVVELTEPPENASRDLIKLLEPDIGKEVKFSPMSLKKLED